MIFNSIAFLIFLTAVLLVHYVLPAAYRWIWVLIASTFFYAYAMPSYTLVPVLITVMAYFAGVQIENAATEKKKQQFHIVSVIAIALILVFFKYTNFFTSIFFDLSHLVTGKKEPNSLFLDIAAPLGISYITFQAIGYLYGNKRGDEKAEKHFGHFATYILLFTKIIAGPVERAQHFLPQLKTNSSLTYENFVSGARQALWGLFKKIVIADRISIYVNAIYNNYDHHSGISLLVASVFYTFQIYADFSGYTDMALGISRMLGYELTPNFNRPLLAKSVTEFWRKWHMSLSSWFADYFYNPIAIAKRDWGQWAVIFACFVTFTVLGFWHGPNWTFIIFGIIQGVVLSFEIFTKKQRKQLRKRIPQWLNDGGGILFTFAVFTFASIFFRADTVTQAVTIIKKISTFKGPFFPDNASTMMLIVMGIAYLMLYECKEEFFDTKFSLSNNKYWLVRNGYYCILIIIILATAVFDGGEFIYFQF